MVKAGDSPWRWSRVAFLTVCLGSTAQGVGADDSIRVGTTAVNAYANGVKQSLRIMMQIAANNPPGVALDSTTEQLQQAATESCRSNWRGLTGLSISAEPTVKELAMLRISQLSQVAGDDPCREP